MHRLKRVCVLGPDRWAGTLVTALRQYSPTVEVICVSNSETGSLWTTQGLASSWTDSFLEGLHGSDMLLVGTGDSGPAWNLREVIISCDPQSLICGHGRTMTEVSRIVRELDRTDFHYVSVVIGGALDWGEAVASLSAENLDGQRIALSPLRIEDLNAFSLLSDVMRQCGCTVNAISPQEYDQQLAQFVQVPQLMRVPYLRQLNSAIDEGGTGIVAESYRLFADFATMGRYADVWSANLFHNKLHVIAALEGCQDQLAQLIAELSNDKMLEIASSVRRQASELSGVTSTEGPRLEALPSATVEATPQTLIEMLETALKVAKRMPVREGVSAESIFELIERTRWTIEDILRAQAVAPEHAAWSPPPPSPDPSPSHPESASGTADWTTPESAAASEAWSAGQPTGEWEAQAQHGTEWDQGVAIVEPEAANGQPEHAPDSGSPTFAIACGHDLQILQTSAQLLTQNRIEIDRIDREEGPSGLTLWVTLAKQEQVRHAKEVLRAANVPVG
jgi:prephenate dehydrogenase